MINWDRPGGIHRQKQISCESKINIFRQTGKQTDRQKDRQQDIDRQTDRQTVTDKDNRDRKCKILTDKSKSHTKAKFMYSDTDKQTETDRLAD